MLLLLVLSNLHMAVVASELLYRLRLSLVVCCRPRLTTLIHGGRPSLAVAGVLVLLANLLLLVSSVPVADAAAAPMLVVLFADGSAPAALVAAARLLVLLLPWLTALFHGGRPSVAVVETPTFADAVLQR